MSAFGKIDIFVNNAGQSTRGPSETITDEMWQADLDLKLFAQVRFCRLLFPQMKERRWGRIISVLNIGAKAPGADSAPTSVSRAAQMAFTKVLSQEGAPYNVLANSLHVGVIVSDQIVRRHQREGANVSLDDFIAQAGRARADGAHGPRRGIRQHRDLPRLRRGLLHHRLRRSTSMAAARRSGKAGMPRRRRSLRRRRLIPRSGGARRGPRPCRRAGRIRSRSSRRSRVRRSAGTRTPSRSRRCPARAVRARRRAAYGR